MDGKEVRTCRGTELLDDASVSADDQDFTVSGVISLAYIVLGDD